MFFLTLDVVFRAVEYRKRKKEEEEKFPDKAKERREDNARRTRELRARQKAEQEAAKALRSRPDRQNDWLTE